MKMYLLVFVLALVACNDYSDGTACKEGSSCSSGCCGWYNYAYTAEGSSYYGIDGTESTYDYDYDTDADVWYICVSDSTASASDNDYYTVSKECSNAMFMTVAASVLALYAF